MGVDAGYRARRRIQCMIQQYMQCSHSGREHGREEKREMVERYSKVKYRLAMVRRNSGAPCTAGERGGYSR